MSNRCWEASTAIARVVIREFNFVPDVVTVPKGGSVCWVHENGDNGMHSIAEAGGSFESNDLQLGETFTNIFCEAGTFYYSCGWNPFMNGIVVVTDSKPSPEENETEELGARCSSVSSVMDDKKKKTERQRMFDDAFVYAAQLNQPSVVLKRIDRGQDVNVHDEDGASALIVASKMGNKEVVNILLSHGALINEPDFKLGRTSLHLACEWGRADIAALLLKHGADIDARDSEFKVTPLHMAACSGHTSVVVTLCAHGVDASILDEHDATAQQAAVLWGRDSIEQILREYSDNCRYWRVVHLLSTRPGCCLHGLPWDLRCRIHTFISGQDNWKPFHANVLGKFRGGGGRRAGSNDAVLAP